MADYEEDHDMLPSMSVYGGGASYMDDDDEQVYLSAYGKTSTPTAQRTVLQHQQQQPTLSSSSSLVARFYWNDRFQSVLERSVFTNEDARQKGAEVRTLLERFCANAIPICEKIVEEFNVPDSEKTIKPCNIGGIAGGKKFMHRNLFIKIADEATATSLYGGLHWANKV